MLFKSVSAEGSSRTNRTRRSAGHVTLLSEIKEGLAFFFFPEEMEKSRIFFFYFAN